MYIPILKEKAGEREALLNLKEDTKKRITPLFEIPVDRIKNPDPTLILDCWEYKYYLDFASEEVAAGIEDTYFNQWFDFSISDNLIPVARLSYSDDRIIFLQENSINGLGLRITLNEFYDDDFKESLNSVLDLLNKSTIDLIVDAQEINESSYKREAASAHVAINNIKNIEDFRSIIIASGSFPDSLSIVPKNETKCIPKNETNYFTLVRDNIKNVDKNNIYYSDYAVNHWSSFEFVLGMQPSFNIRYTLDDSYYVYKGETIKKGGLSYDNVQKACQKLVQSNIFYGNSFSWADTIIHNISTEDHKKGGNLTKWRSYGTNHHVEAIVNQLANLS